MADKDTANRRSRSLARALQHTAEQAGPAAGAGYTLIGAILLLAASATPSTTGAARPLVSRRRLLLGIVVGMYELAKTVWHNEGGRGWSPPACLARCAVAIGGRETARDVLLGCSRRSARRRCRGC
jgi:hypothetical protein